MLMARMCFDLFLLGVVLHQMITYCSAPNKDRLYVKCTVVCHASCDRAS